MNSTRRLAVALAVLIIVGYIIHALTHPAASQDCEVGTFGCGHHQQHEQYKVWKPKSGKGNCCNGDDCRPVRARVEIDGTWSVWIPEFRSWISVPDFAVGEADRFRDGRNHVCSSKPMPLMPFHIYCFSPTGSKS